MTSDPIDIRHVWNARFVAFATSVGLSPDEAIADRENLGRFIVFISQKWREFGQETKTDLTLKSPAIHAAFDMWLERSVHLLPEPAAPDRPVYVPGYWIGRQPELNDEIAIWMDDPEGGDPYMVATLKRIYRPEILEGLSVTGPAVSATPGSGS